MGSATEGLPTILDGGIMGERLRLHDWAATPLGPVEAWPQSLRTALSIMLNSAFPTFLAWGPELISFYNDACTPLMGDKPDGLGRPFPEVWAEAWDVVSPIAERALRGEASYFEDLPLTLTPKSYPEQTWFSFAYSPIHDETGRVGGIMCTVHETTQRVRAEVALRESETRLAAILEQLPLGVGLVGRDGKILLANRALGRYALGIIPSSDPEMARLWRTYTPEGRPVAPSDYPGARALRGETVFPGVDFIYTSPEGQESWTRVSSAPFKNTAQDIAGAIIVVQDIDRKKRGEAALQESQTRLQAAVDLVGLSPYSWNPSTGALEWGAGLKAMWGLPPDASIDQDVWLSAIHSEDRSRVEAAVARCCDPAGDGVYHTEYRVVGITDGKERWVSTHGRATFENGRPVDFVGVAIELNEPKHAEAALQESEDRFLRFAEHSTSAIWIFNTNSMSFEYISPAYERLWGEPRARLLLDWSYWLDAMHQDDRPCLAAAVERVRLGEVVVAECRIIRPDGAVHWVRNTLFPIQDEQGRVQRIGGISEDITQHDGRFVYIVDADAVSRNTLSCQVRRAGYDVRTFPSGKAFLETAPALKSGCVVIDIRSPDTVGLEIPRELKARRIGIPVIVLGETQGDDRFGVQVMKAGAVDFLPIPYQADELLAAIATAAADIRRIKEYSQEAGWAQARIGEMSEREREVLQGLLAGRTNKQIGRDIGISPRTVETHRAHVMQRLGARTIPEAVRIAAMAGLLGPPWCTPEALSDSH